MRMLWLGAGLVALIVSGGTAFAQDPEVPMQELVYCQGDSHPVGDGAIHTWVRLDKTGQPEAVGVTFTEAMLNNLPADQTSYQVNLPGYVPHAPYSHFGLDWNPKGHFPHQFYGVPHFDFHFYIMTPEARSTMTGTGDNIARVMKEPPAEFVPEGYVAAKPAVAYMGLHWVRMDFPEFHGTAFTETPIYGSYDGKLSFIEPMVTVAFLQTHPNVDKPLHEPREVQVSGYYPTRYVIKYDEARKLYTVALEGMRYRESE